MTEKFWVKNDLLKQSVDCDSSLLQELGKYSLGLGGDKHWNNTNDNTKLFNHTVV